LGHFPNAERGLWNRRRKNLGIGGTQGDDDDGPTEFNAIAIRRMSDPKKKIFLITGVSSGFGHAFAEAALLGGFMMFMFSSAAGMNAAETARNEIRATLHNWTKDFNARNVSKVYTLFAPDLISNYQGQPTGDYHSLCAQLRTSLNDPDKSYHYSFRINEIQVCRHLAIVRLTWHLRVNHKGSPGEDFIEETSLDIFRRQPDGSWKISRFNAYPSKTN
jgi:ketosteroid isomerase-like protein